MSTNPTYDVPRGVARFNGWFFDRFDGFIDLFIRPVKRRTYDDLPDEIVELGAGAGANFRYLKRGTRVVAIEPNRFMHPRLQRRARRYGIDVEIRPAMGEAIDLPDDSTNAVIASLVLCTVRDPDRVLAEIRRVLRPGGRFVFVEHVAAPEGSWRHRLQVSVKRPWRYVFEGCEPDRHTAGVVSRAGFSQVTVDRHRMHSPFVPANTLVAGTAVA